MSSTAAKIGALWTCLAASGARPVSAWCHRHGAISRFL